MHPGGKATPGPQVQGRVVHVFHEVAVPALLAEAPAEGDAKGGREADPRSSVLEAYHRGAKRNMEK